MAGIETVAKAVPLFVIGQRPVMERNGRLTLNVIFNQCAGVPEAKQIVDSRRVLRIAPQEGLKRRQQAAQPNCRGVGFAEDLQGVRMVIRGREALLVER